jgi:hypothetical protein
VSYGYDYLDAAKLIYVYLNRTSQTLNSPAVSGLRSPPRLPSPPAITLTQSSPPGSPLPEQIEEAYDSDSQTASGSTTPTKATEQSTPRKSRAFLDLSPLAGFLRSRYPSSIRSTTSKGSASADLTDVSAREADEEAVSEEPTVNNASGTSGHDSNKSEINGHANVHGVVEKFDEREETTTRTHNGTPVA